MTVTREAMDRLERHWAVAVVTPQNRERANALARQRHAKQHVGRQLHLILVEQPGDQDRLERLALAYELAAIEGLDSLLHPSADPASVELRQQAEAGANRAYELSRGFPLPHDQDARLFHVLHLAALAYCGDRWSDLRRWINEHPEAVEVPSVANVEWDRRVTYRLFDCWVRLLRKNGWDDLDRVREIVSGLREDQKRYESEALSADNDAETRTMAFRLVALYHWAKASELLAVYMLQGQPPAVATLLDQHFEAGRDAARDSGDAALEILLRWLHVAARSMVAGSVWWVTGRVNSRVTRFIEHVTKKSRPIFELLPPQRAALQEQGLLDPSSQAVVVDLPTSAGKTVLAEFRILQALNQFDAEQGWVAYVAPTRALTQQIARRLREDFEPLGIHVELLTAATEIDCFEEELLAASQSALSFHVLVATPEKLDLVIRNKKVSRPLALVVLDEAQNLEDEERGLRIELTLATIKRDCPSTNFLLLMPDVPNAKDLAKWLAPDSGRSISLSTGVWQPNERIVGLYRIRRSGATRRTWSLEFESLTTTPRALHLGGTHLVGPAPPLKLSYTKAKTLFNQTAAMATVFSERGTSIAVARTIPDCWSMARTVAKDLPPIAMVPAEIGLVQRFLQTEVSPKFELIDMLSHGVAVHHSGLSDETRALIERLAEMGLLRVLCATTTIAQGINFPVTSVFLASRLFPYGREMSPRAFWNLAGRAGRISHDSIGVVGLAAGDDPDAVRRYVSQATGDLVSRLLVLLDKVEEQRRLGDLSLVIHEEQWADFRSYVAHLWREKQNLDAVLAETEQLLRQTFGYSVLQAKNRDRERRQAEALRTATRNYVRKIAENPGGAMLADSTGFAPEGVMRALAELGKLPRKLTPADWEPQSLFGPQGGSVLSRLVGVMMHVPEIKGTLEQISNEGLDQRHIAQVAQAWVTGASLEAIARRFFSGPKDDPRSETEAITVACRAIYRHLANAATWGLSALSKLGPSGLDYEKLPPEARRQINSLPAMLYHGVASEDAVLMRMNSVPRTVAETLGKRFAAEAKLASPTSRLAREFLRTLEDGDWQRAAPSKSVLTGTDYKAIWQRLAGETE